MGRVSSEHAPASPASTHRLGSAAARRSGPGRAGNGVRGDSSGAAGLCRRPQPQPGPGRRQPQPPRPAIVAANPHPICDGVELSPRTSWRHHPAADLPGGLCAPHFQPRCHRQHRQRHPTGRRSSRVVDGTHPVGGCCGGTVRLLVGSRLVGDEHGDGAAIRRSGRVRAATGRAAHPAGGHLVRQGAVPLAALHPARPDCSRCGCVPGPEDVVPDVGRRLTASPNHTA